MTRSDKLRKIKAVVLDVDGVLTDGGISVTPEGDFIRKYNSKDGYALSLALKKGYHIAIITGGKGNSLKVRFDMLGVDHVYMDCHEKLKALKELCDELDVSADEILYMGDDVPDLELLVAGHHGSSGSTSEELLDALMALIEEL